MLTFLLIVLFVSLTFLVTGFRRHLEIKDIKAAHAAQMHLRSSMMYYAGFRSGVESTKIPMPGVHMHTYN